MCNGGISTVQCATCADFGKAAATAAKWAAGKQIMPGINAP